MANKRLNWVGKTVNGVWKVLEQTNRKSKANSIIYKCLNLINKQIYYKSSAYLKQFQKRGSKKLTRGKVQKYVRLPLNLKYDDFIKLAKQYAKEFGLDINKKK